MAAGIIVGAGLATAAGFVVGLTLGVGVAVALVETSCGAGLQPAAESINPMPHIQHTSLNTDFSFLSNPATIDGSALGGLVALRQTFDFPGQGG